MTEKTLGQIAFEASQQWNGFPRTWLQISLSEMSHWEHVAQAVAQAVAPMPEVGP